MECIFLGICGYVIFRIMRRSDGSASCKPVTFVPERAKDEMAGWDVESFFLLEEVVDRPLGRRDNGFQERGEIAEDEVGDGYHLCFDDEFIQ